MSTTTAGLLYLFAGLGLLLAAALPRWSYGRAFSPPLVFITLGLIAGWLTPSSSNWLNWWPSSGGTDTDSARLLVEHVTELVVVVALFGVGLAIDRPFGWRTWRSTWRLLLIVMPVSIALVAGLGWAIVGLVPAAALLVGAALAPTDPVLASEVQVGAPADEPTRDDAEDDIRFALTSEAGLNDGLAFPFVYAAVLLATGAGIERLGGWVAWELVGKVALGVAAGVIVGVVLSRLAFDGARLGVRFAQSADALVSLAGIGVAYGAAELVGGYGFLAVFVAALVLRSRERAHRYHRVLHGFVQEIEQLLTLGVLVVLGYACARGLLDALTAGGLVLAVVLVFIVRPVVGWVALAGIPLARPRRAAIAFFGVRGVGSVYYVAFAAGQATFPDLAVVWATVAVTVLLSVFVHGTLAGPVMARLGNPQAPRAEAT